MIPNIVDGGNTVGLMQYLVGPGRANEHTEPHLVAGDASLMAVWGDWSELSPAQATELARALDLNMTLTGTYPTGTVRSYDPEEGQQVTRSGPNHVWHCSLSLSPDEGPLSEDKWARIAQDFMDEMGFTEASGKAPCRWVAVHHGQSKNGGDHIHIVANIVREDGTKWSPWYDQRRSQKACNLLEHRYGLEVLESREHARGSRCDSAAAQNAAKRQGKQLTDRAALETRVRAAATAADTEKDFVIRLRQLGVRARPRFAHGRTDVVVGYSVALHTEPGQQTQWYGGGRLARDLTLARLRTRWPDTPDGAQDAVDAWREAWRGGPLRRRTRDVSREEWSGHVQTLDMYLDEFSQIDPTDPQALADATHDIAGVLAAAALRHQGTPQGRVFDRAARQIARHAQTHRRTAERNQSYYGFTLAARLLTTAVMRPGLASEIMLAASMLQLAARLATLYQQAQQANTARRILTEAQRAFATINTGPLTQQNSRVYQVIAAMTPPTQQDNLPPRRVRPPAPAATPWDERIAAIIAAQHPVQSTSSSGRQPSTPPSRAPRRPKRTQGPTL